MTGETHTPPKCSSSQGRTARSGTSVRMHHRTDQADNPHSPRCRDNSLCCRTFPGDTVPASQSTCHSNTPQDSPPGWLSPTDSSIQQYSWSTTAPRCRRLCCGTCQSGTACSADPWILPDNSSQHHRHQSSCSTPPNSSSRHHRQCSQTGLHVRSPCCTCQRDSSQEHLWPRGSTDQWDKHGQQETGPPALLSDSTCQLHTGTTCTWHPLSSCCSDNSGQLHTPCKRKHRQQSSTRSYTPAAGPWQRGSSNQQGT